MLFISSDDMELLYIQMISFSNQNDYRKMSCHFIDENCGMDYINLLEFNY